MFAQRRQSHDSHNDDDDDDGDATDLVMLARLNRTVLTACAPASDQSPKSAGDEETSRGVRASSLDLTRASRIIIINPLGAKGCDRSASKTVGWTEESSVGGLDARPARSK